MNKTEIFNKDPNQQKDTTNQKILTQQVLHKGLFITRPRALSLSDITNANAMVTNDDNEGECTVATGGKRQLESPETTKNPKQTKLNAYWLGQPIPVSNRFSVLEIEDENNEHQISAEPKEKSAKPPPIFVDKVSNIQPLIQMLNDHANGNYEIKVFHNEQVRIQPKTQEVYSTIVKQLELKDTEFFTYKPKQERNFKVVLKNIHPSTDTEEIKRELSELGHSVTNIWNIKQRLTKKPLPIFIVEIKPNSDNKTIYDVKFLLNCRIIIEPPRFKRDIPQCANCQQYGHTKTYCRRKPKCIKCAGNHLSINCERIGRSNEVKCVLCQGNHPANYKGCSVYKELQKTKYPPLRKRQQPQPTEAVIQPNRTTRSEHNTFQSKRTYAQSTRNKDSNQDIPIHDKPYPQSEKDPKDLNNLLIDMLRQIMQQMTTMTHLLVNLTTKLQCSASN